MEWRECDVKKSVSDGKKFLKTRHYVEDCLKKGITSPSKMAREYNRKFGLEGDKELGDKAFTMAMRRMGVSAKKRLELKHEAMKETEVKDIEDYAEVKRYLGFSDFQQIGKRHKRATLRNLRELWVMMGCTNPHTWVFTFEEGALEENNLIACLKKHIGLTESGQWKRQNKVLQLLGAFNRTFQGNLPKGWSMGLKREAGELKDFFEFEEFYEFISKTFDTPTLSKEGWEALYKAQLNMGCREGARGKTGIVSLKWENINYNTKRCKIRDKGKKGKPARLWTQIPLDIFYWIHGWDSLMRYHEQRFGYRPTQDQHATGLVFPISYWLYRTTFHQVRQRCNSRISQDLETMRPHIFRKTHGQWAKRIGVNLENLCGNTESSPCVGRYGVGWDDPKVPLQYYLTPEPEEYEEQDQKIQKRLEKLTSKGILPMIHAPLITWKNVAFGENATLAMQ